jgi:hypothetical protein
LPNEDREDDADVHNETLFVAAIVRLQPRSFARWNQSLKRSPTPTGFAEMVSDDFLILHGLREHSYD